MIKFYTFFLHANSNKQLKVHDGNFSFGNVIIDTVFKLISNF